MTSEKKNRKQKNALNNYNFYIILVLLIAVSGCNGISTASEGLDVRIETSPNKLFPGGKVTLFIDVENKDEKTYNNILIDVFDTGELVGECQKAIQQMKPQAIGSLECQLGVPSELKKDQNVWTKVTFDGHLTGSLQVEIISQEEYELRTRLGTLQRQAKSYSFADKNLQVALDFEESPPFVPGKQQFVRIKIRNIGAGLVESIKPGAVSVQSDIISCPPKGELFPVGKEFPTIACEVKVPTVNYLSQSLINIDIKYSYDVREKTPIPK